MEGEEGCESGMKHWVGSMPDSFGKVGGNLGVISWVSKANGVVGVEGWVEVEGFKILGGWGNPMWIIVKF